MVLWLLTLYVDETEAVVSSLVSDCMLTIEMKQVKEVLPIDEIRGCL